jgi:hypothetical protein
MGTYWKQQKSNTPTLPPKEEKLRLPWCMLPHLIGYKNFFCLPMCFVILGPWTRGVQPSHFVPLGPSPYRYTPSPFWA